MIPGIKRKRDKAATAARNRLLPEGRVAGPMPWVIAIMMFLTVLAAAAGLGLLHASRALGADLSGRVTVQLIDADPVARNDAVRRLVRALPRLPGVVAVQPVPESQLADQLRPWLGTDLAAAELPIPALVDVTLAATDPAAVATFRRAVAAIVPQARVEPHAAFLAPLSGLMTSLAGLAVALVLLMALATGAVVVLAARGAHDSHRGTIDVLHLMGATDIQIARLFQRRIALDASFGGALGFAAAAAVIAIIGQRLGATGSDMLQTIHLSAGAWLLLLALPLAGVLLAMLTARMTVLSALGRQL
ncbi:cell division protein FtsX [Sphingobium algorifonticola]|uniref:Cell division protein n=1 Tax=Sphingobium algorifonticola TaxID=2008318 RepID=A0A437JD53_9SPHN|nr:cell division protein [Sphingobium algorifonticola]RVT43835.1 cell division protein [Sphingobium algorifonticola]